jgi:hypothetical protein
MDVLVATAKSRMGREENQRGHSQSKRTFSKVASNCIIIQQLLARIRRKKRSFLSW